MQTNDLAAKSIIDNSNIFKSVQKDSFELLTDAEFLLYAIEYLKINPNAKSRTILNLRRKRYAAEF